MRPYGRRAVHRPAVHSVHTAGPAGELLRRQALLLLGQRLRTLVQNPGSVPGPGPGTSRAQQLHPPFQPLRGVRRRAAAHTRAKRRLEHTRGRSGASAARESERAWSSAALAAEACDLDRACAQACGIDGGCPRVAHLPLHGHHLLLLHLLLHHHLRVHHHPLWHPRRHPRRRAAPCLRSRCQTRVLRTGVRHRRRAVKGW